MLTDATVSRRSGMICPVMNSPNRVVLALCAALGSAALPALAQKNLEKPLAGPRATALQVTSLYVSPDTSAQRIDKVQIGREMVVAEKSGPWLRVYANTDIEELQNSKDTPMVGSDETPPPISGWAQAKGIVVENTPNGDQIVMGTAANEEALASDPRGPANSAQAARLLYRRVVEMFPNSPLAPEAAWRSADIHWQIEKADVNSRPSAKEQNPALRPEMDESDLKHVIKYFPHTPQADKAAFNLIDDKLCGDWQGQPKCPERESGLYEKYAEEHPDGPRTAQALYNAIYRQCVLVDMYNADQNDRKAGDAKKHAHDLIDRLHQKFAQSDYTARASALVYKIDQGIPVYGIDQQ